MNTEPTRRQLEDMRGCACLRVRRAARALTRRYDAALRPCGLRVTQLPLLVAPASREGWTVQALAEQLAMERTTLLRNLKPLVDRGALVVEPEGNGGAHVVKITAAGRRLLARAYPLWRASQEAVVSKIGYENWTDVLDDVGAAVEGRSFSAR
jgi:DNA-binding MarR family transcriptional regulator